MGNSEIEIEICKSRIQLRKKYHISCTPTHHTHISIPNPFLYIPSPAHQSTSETPFLKRRHGRKGKVPRWSTDAMSSRYLRRENKVLGKQVMGLVLSEEMN